MSSVSFLRCMVLVLLTGATAQAQAPGDGFVPPQPVEIPPQGATDLRDTASETVQPVEQWPRPISRAGENASGVFDRNWLDLTTPPPRYKAWASVDFALMWLSGAAVPPLITSSASGIPTGTAAVLGASTTSTRVGGFDLESNPTSGLRFAVGSWLNDLNDRGVEVNGFVLGGRNDSFGVSGSGLANGIAVGRPIVNTEGNNEAVLYTAFANKLAGDSFASLNTNLWGIDANALARIPISDTVNVVLLGGVRYIDLDQNLAIRDDIRPLGANTIPFANLTPIGNPNLVRISDAFQTTNQFVGGQFGFRTGFDLGRLGFGLGFKLGLGETHRTLTINGQTEAFTPIGQLIGAVPGGLLANTSNIGRYEQNAFSVVPEFDLKISYRILDNLYAFVGYDYLMWTQVIMPGNQISRIVNPSNAPTSGAFSAGTGALGNTTVSQTNLVVNSITFGIRLTY